MSEWISVHQSPDQFDGLRRFTCKVLVGSMNVEEVEMVLLGRHTPAGFRFLSGDWQQVTHWKPFVEPPK